MPSLREVIEQAIHRPPHQGLFSARGAMRVSQTLLKVYPRVLQWGLKRRKPTPVELRELFESLGATYIKFGQLIASSPSVFPKEYVDEFQKLLDKTPSIPFHQIKTIIEHDLGQPIHSVFTHIDPTPLASASIAQVHSAQLRSGEDVVIKVQKPGVDTIINVDMNTAYLCARIMEIILPGMDKDTIAGLVTELYQAMIDECDFYKEAQNLEDFRQYLSANQLLDVTAPRPYRPASGKKVLTMERFYGRPLTDIDSVKASSNNPSAVLLSAINAWFGSLTQCSSFHADLHNGNMMVLEDGRVAFIDFGMVGRIEPEAWQGMFGLIAGLNGGDYHKVAESMLAVGMTKDTVNVEQLTKDIQQLFDGVYDVDPALVLSETGGSTVIDKTMTKLGEIAKRYGIRFPRSFTLLLKQFLYFDRYIESLAPDLDLFSSAHIAAFGPRQ